MARLRHCCPVSILQHAIQRGNNRRACFTCDKDRVAYAHWLFEAISGQRFRHLKPGPKPTKKKQIENDNFELLL